MLLLAEYLGGAITCDAYHMTDPRADGLGVSTCIELAMKDAGIEKEQVHALPFCPASGSMHVTSVLDRLRDASAIHVDRLTAQNRDCHPWSS